MLESMKSIAKFTKTSCTQKTALNEYFMWSENTKKKLQACPISEIPLNSAKHREID